MPVDSKEVRCDQCVRVLEESTDLAPEDRQSCPACGSLSRNIHVSINGSITFHGKLFLKGQREIEKRPFIEQVVGEYLYRKSGKWMKIQRIIDRLRDWYSEKVIDPETGEIVHACEEPLSEHRGHGSARKRIY